MPTNELLAEVQFLRERLKKAVSDLARIQSDFLMTGFACVAHDVHVAIQEVINNLDTPPIPTPETQKE